MSLAPYFITFEIQPKKFPHYPTRGYSTTRLLSSLPYPTLPEVEKPLLAGACSSVMSYSSTSGPCLAASRPIWQTLRLRTEECVGLQNCRFNKDQGASFFLREEQFWLQETFLPKHPVRKRVEEKSFVFKFCFYLFPSFATSFSSVGFHLGKKLFQNQCLDSVPVGFKLIAY